MPPRATFKTITPSFICWNSWLENMLRVSSVSGICTVMTSASASTSSTVS